MGVFLTIIGSLPLSPSKYPLFLMLYKLNVKNFLIISPPNTKLINLSLCSNENSLNFNFYKHELKYMILSI